MRHKPKRASLRYEGISFLTSVVGWHSIRGPSVKILQLGRHLQHVMIEDPTLSV